MTPVERKFVEAAVLDGEGTYAPDLEHLKSLLAEYPSLIETAGAAALSAAFFRKEADDVVRFRCTIGHAVRFLGRRRA